MAVFFIVVVLMIILTVAALCWPLLRTAAPDSSDRKAVNLAIAKQRLRELGRERENGTLGDEAYELAKAELELMLAGDLDDSEEREAKAGGKWMAGLVLLGVPVVAGWLYFQLGSPMFIDDKMAMAQGSAHDTGAPPVPADIAAMIEQLEQRMKEVPDDPEGQRLLVRTYMSQQRFADAVAALNSWGARTSGNPDLLVMLADATASQAGGRLIGEPEKMLEDALEVDPEHMQALWILGYAKAQNNNAEGAIAAWERLLPLVANDAEAVQQVKANISDAQKRAGIVPAEAAGAEQVAVGAAAGQGLQLEVSLDAALAAKVSADTAVFVYAKTPTGPPMPLAVVKLRVADLPMTVMLDDSTAMIPTHKLSGQSDVTVGARVSLSGGPVAQPGDHTVELENVQSPSKDAVKLVISEK